MAIVHRTALVDRPAHHLFDLIEAAEHYPRFLPWCVGATILERSESLVSAELQVRWHGLDFRMVTRNPMRRPEHMRVQLARGPFRRFEGEWKLRSLGESACKVEFVLDWDFDAAWATAASAHRFGRMADMLMDAFVARAQEQPVREG